MLLVLRQKRVQNNNLHFDDASNACAWFKSSIPPLRSPSRMSDANKMIDNSGRTALAVLKLLKFFSKKKRYYEHYDATPRSLAHLFQKRIRSCHGATWRRSGCRRSTCCGRRGLRRSFARRCRRGVGRSSTCRWQASLAVGERNKMWTLKQLAAVPNPASLTLLSARNVLFTASLGNHNSKCSFYPISAKKKLSAFFRQANKVSVKMTIVIICLISGAANLWPPVAFNRPSCYLFSKQKI